MKNMKNDTIFARKFRFFAMLGRRILRIKAFKTIYAYAVTGKMTQEEAARQLSASCEAVRDLYLFMLSIIPYLTAESRSRIEAARGKLNPTEEDLNPNLKFASNALSALLEGDPDFCKLLERKKLSWAPYDIFIREVFDSMSGKDWFRSYMAAPGKSLKEDCKLFTRVFEEEFVDNAALEPILEDISLLWVDDLAYALTWCCYTMNDFARGRSWSLPPLYMSEVIEKKDPTVESDKDFVEKLLRSAVASYGKYSEMTAASVTQWEKDRLFDTDLVLISMGLAEAELFPDIPVKVTINEYVDISKFYSTPKSSSFVNGLLDTLFPTAPVLICLGLAEAATFPQIPVKVTINEYVEISKYYSTPKSRAFVNSLLDKLIQQLAAEGGIVKSGAGLK